MIKSHFQGDKTSIVRKSLFYAGNVESMNIRSYECIHSADRIDTSDIQKKVDALSYVCRTPSSEKLKYLLMNRNGAFLNIPKCKTTPKYFQILPKRSSNLNVFKSMRTQCDSCSVPGELVEVSEGYILQKTNDKIHVTLTEEFWNAENFRKQESAKKACKIKAKINSKTNESISVPSWMCRYSENSFVNSSLESGRETEHSVLVNYHSRFPRYAKKRDLKSREKANFMIDARKSFSQGSSIKMQPFLPVIA